jgi:hypothetical protein
MDSRLTVVETAAPRLCYATPANGFHDVLFSIPLSSCNSAEMLSSDLGSMPLGSTLRICDIRRDDGPVDRSVGWESGR